MCRYASTFNTVDVQAATVRLNKTNATLVKGQTLQLKLQGTSKKAKWYSSRKRVATITQNGKIIARNKGVTTITAQIGNKKYVSRITVETPKISKTSINLNEGESYTLKVSATSQKAKWTSINEFIATVNSKGIVTAQNEGKTKIIATISNIKYTCIVTVNRAKILTIDKNNITISDDTTILVTSRSGKALRYSFDETSIIECKWGDWGDWYNGVCSIPLYITPQMNGSTTVTITEVESGETVRVKVTVTGLSPSNLYNKSPMEERLGIYGFYVLNNILKNPNSLMVHGVYTGISNQFYSPRQLTIIDYSAMNSFGGYVRSYYGCWTDDSNYFHTGEFTKGLDECFPSGYTRLDEKKLMYIAKNVRFG